MSTETPARILLAEDDKSLAAGVEWNLRERGYEVMTARDGRAAVRYFEEFAFDLVILDVMLPFIDGYEIARRIREQSLKQPILMLTARTTPADRIQGLEAGADDYLIKPFHLEELMLRVSGMLKRKRWYAMAEDTDSFSFGDVKLDFGDLTGHRGEVRFTMTPLEGALLRYLIEHRERIVSKGELLKNIWSVATETETRSVENFIVRVRRLVEKDPRRPIHIKTVRGAGYIFRST